ncbi:MAG: SDR family NAD(P)-dependent oxidoreductase [Nitriliruptoraceae bacterium]
MSTLPAPLTRAVDAALEATVVLSFSRIGHAVRSRLDDWTPLTDLQGDGRRAIVTGANSGLGYATARALLLSGARVLVTVRSEEKAERTRARLRADLGRDLDDTLETDLLDLGDLGSVRAFAQRREAEDAPIDVLVHNAGALFDAKALTVDGLERTYQVHVVAPFLLTSLLLPSLAAAAPSRVVTVTSGGMYAEKLVTARVDSPGEYRGTVAYARAKRAQVTLTREWQRRFGATGVGFHVVHPGWALTPGVESSLPGFRKLTGPILRDVDEGADTIVYLALAADLPEAGRLWHDRRPRGEHKVPWTLPERGEAGELWARVCRDAGVEPTVPATGG